MIMQIFFVGTFVNRLFLWFGFYSFVVSINENLFGSFTINQVF